MATLFERIAAGELPADIVYQDAEITAFRDIHPRAPVHILIIPNKPIPTSNDISDADAPLIGRLFLVARDLARKLGIAEDGYRLIVNCNAHGGQEVYHLHLHLIGGALGLFFARPGGILSPIIGAIAGLLVAAIRLRFEYRNKS